MNEKQFIKLGKMLGKEWQSPLARLLPCNIRTIQYWAKGEREIRPMVAQRIKDVVRAELVRRAMKQDSKDIGMAKKVIAKKNRTWTQEEMEKQVVGEVKEVKASKKDVEVKVKITDKKTWNQLKRAPVGSLLKNK